jgi:hypothetical protein
VDEPGDAMANAMRANSMPLHEAIRFSTQYFSCLGNAVPIDKVRIFGSSYYQTNLGDLISDVLKEIVGSVDEVVKSRVIERVAPDLPSRSDSKVQDVIGLHTQGALLPGRARNQLSLQDQGLIKSVADAYRPIFEKRDLAMIEWPREMFFTASEGNSRPGDIALIGRARHIVWGPYLHLPPGGWRVTIQFEVIENISGNEIEADVCVGMLVAAVGRTVLPAHGYFEFFLDFMVADPNLPIEIRVLLLKGAIEGRFGLRKVILNPIKFEDQGQAALSPRAEQARLDGPSANKRGLRKIRELAAVVQRRVE